MSMQVLCAAWTADGQHLALGMYNGHISICDKSGVEQVLNSLLSSSYVKKEEDDMNRLICMVWFMMLHNSKYSSHQFITLTIH